MPRYGIAICLLALLGGTATAAADYPERPITFIIPFGPGGGSDTGARTWQPYLEACLGEGASLVMVNRPGASGELGFAEIAASAPDGYTLGLTNVPNMPLAHITHETTFDLDSFEYLGSLFGASVTLNVGEDSEIQTLDQLVEHARSAAVPIKIAVGGIGTDDHLIALRFAKQAGIAPTFIPMSDGGSARNALLGGHIEVAGMSITATMEFQDDIRTLAVSLPERTDDLPDVPTFREQGYDIVGGSSYVIGAPKGLPQDVHDKLASCFEQIGADEQFRAEATSRGLILNPLNAEEATAWVLEESAALKALWESDPWM